MNRPRRTAGFTLLEVMIAMAILAMVLVPLLGAIIKGQQAISASKFRSHALRLAEDKMTELEMTVLPEDEGEWDGDFGNDHEGYRWRMELVKSPDLELAEEMLNIKARELYLHVTWVEEGTEKSLTLATMVFLGA